MPAKSMPRILKNDDVFSSFNKIQELIQERAYQLFEGRSSDSSDPINDWLEAESEVLSGISMTFKDKDNEVLIEGSIDEFLPEDIEVKAQDRKFKICGIHTEKTSDEKKGVSSTTSSQSYFHNSFTLPDSVDTENMEVNIKDGKFAAKIPKSSQ